MKLKFQNLILFVTFLVPCTSTSCNQTCGDRKVPFPFGFSAGCQIQLNCSSSGTLLAADFPVLSITSDTIFVNLPAKCGRPVEALRGLFTSNYAPTSRENAILLQNCSRPLDHGCVIPTTLVRSSFGQFDCNVVANNADPNISCYSGPDGNSTFIDYMNLKRSGCQSVLTAVSVSILSNESTLDVQTLNVGWWLKGKCLCAENARCENFSLPGEGLPQAYRCQCHEGFIGDGFQDGQGCRKGSGSSHALFDMKKLLIGLLASVVGVVTLFILVVYIRRRLCSRHGTSKETYQNVESFLLKHGSLAPKRYSYSEIKKITKSFSDKLGQGGYGSVYKGMLPKPNGQLVAVKLLTKTMSDGEEFINEVASISRTSHVNVVNLLGFCYERKERALVYEFMPNKSLDKFIYEHRPLSQLHWERMYKIAIGVARGLEYLHKGCNTRIVHFDIKPQNILLDEDFCPKISDFGLAKLCGKKQSILSMLGTRGTIGYIAPEVFSRNYGGVSHKSDVYSFGMMVLEMTGARNNVGVGSIQSSESYFLDKIYERITLHETRNSYDIEIAGEEGINMKMLLVAFWCIQTAPSDRPSISKVVEMLEGSLQHIEIPPMPVLFTTQPLRHEITTSESRKLETENSIES